MSLTKEQLLSVNSLKLSGIIDEMDEQQFADYCKALFIDRSGAHEKNDSPKSILNTLAALLFFTRITVRG